MRFSGAMLFVSLLTFAGMMSVARAHPESTCNHCVHHCHYDGHNHSVQSHRPAAAQPAPVPSMATSAPVPVVRTITAPTRNGRHRHEGGFLRFTGGKVNYDASEFSSAFDSGSVWQLGELSIGGSSSEDLSWHVTLALSSWEPSDDGTNRFASEHSGAIYMGLVGFGFTHHWMPSNFYLSASLGRSFKTRTSVNVRSAIDSLGSLDWHSLGASVVFGKEWWLSDDLGVGIAYQGVVLNTKEGRYIYGGPVISVTYN